MDTSKLSTEGKSCASFLRERFLFLTASLPANKSCKINMYNKTEATAQIRAFDLSYENIIVDNLRPIQQPDTVVSHAILRTSDINYIFYNDI